MERRLATMYLAVALALTTVLVWVTPPFFGPDEPNQSMRALTLLEGRLLPEPGVDEAGGEVDTGALEAMNGVDEIRMRWEPQSRDFHDRNYGPMTEAAQARLAGVRWTGQKSFAGFGNTATYPPGLYGPAMLGWWIAERLRWTIFASLRLARWMNALAAVLVGWWALRRAEDGAWILLPGLLLPSTLFLAATCSPDGLMVSVASMAVAMIWRAVRQGRALRAGELAGLGVLVGMCAMARPPYLVLGMLLFVPAMELRTRERRVWLVAAGVFAAVIAVCAAWWSAAGRFGVDTADEANPGVQKVFLREHPLHAGAAVVRGTMEAAWDFVHRGLYVVGWDDLLPHHGAALVLGAGVLLLVWSAPGLRLRAWTKVLVGCAVVGPLLGISLAEYVIWTPPGLGTVYGVQPRYWLPVVSAAMLMLTSWRRSERMGVWVRAAAVAVLLAVACTLPWMEARAFYRTGLADVLRMSLR